EREEGAGGGGGQRQPAGGGGRGGGGGGGGARPPPRARAPPLLLVFGPHRREQQREEREVQPGHREQEGHLESHHSSLIVSDALMARSTGSFTGMSYSLAWAITKSGPAGVWMQRVRQVMAVAGVRKSMSWPIAGSPASVSTTFSASSSLYSAFRASSVWSASSAGSFASGRSDTSRNAVSGLWTITVHPPSPASSAWNSQFSGY